MTVSSAGLHHITAICGDPAENRRFFVDVLGLRLVKKTVNFDDPGTYHLYYGDEVGTPGSALTFFAFSGAPRGQHGLGAATEIAFAVPTDTLDFWQAHLATHGVDTQRITRFNEEALCFTGPHGNSLALVASDWAAAIPGRRGASVDSAYAIRGFHGVTLWIAELAPSAAVLEQVLGFQQGGHDSDRVRFIADVGNTLGSIVDLRVDPDLASARQGVGSVHHVAFRANDDAHENALRERLIEHGLQVTPTIDRQYFRSVYFREPAGVLFEIATDGPGFTIDEPVEALGTSLKLPPKYEKRRALIEQALFEL
ncbi:glyoxalase/bleomycin resistance protein/dioxygenase [Salinisphaera shabanensis T35B1]|uniref:ring-cleaving dioxygenase n=1 Tax=Salinisphaera shabanensis TaxID=180542 RepID=UPI0033400890